MDAPRVTVQRHDSPLGSWEMAQAEPAAHLRGQVLRYCAYRERTPAPLRRREVATTVVPLIVSYERRIRLLDPDRPERVLAHPVSFVAGLYDGPAVTEHQGEQEGVQIDLSPLAARRLLGVPMSELAGRVVALEDVLGPAGRELAERLADAPDHAARFALLDAVLTRGLEAAAPTPASVAGAYTRLAAAHGCLPVEELAAEAGWSRRNLVKRFHDHVGLAPKALARVLRFQRVVARCGSEEERLAELAYACGYADQAHLNREFRALAGTTPSRFLASRLPDAGGVAA